MRTSSILVGLMALAGTSAGAETIPLDLADDGAKMIVPAGTEVTFELRHRLPGAGYTYETGRIGLLDPLLLPETGEEDPGSAAVDPECKRILAGVKQAGEGNSERTLRAALLAAHAEAPNDCRERIQIYEQGTRVELADKVTIGEGQTVIVTIVRSEPEPGKTWVFEIGTGEDRLWLIHYGFAFLPDEDEDFATRAVEGDDGGFTIVDSGTRSEAEFEPTVTFTYLPRTLGRNPWIPKFTAGLGADIEEQLVFAGLSWVIGDNVSLFAGAAGHEQTRLKGIYDEGQQVEEALTGDQLVDETYDVNLIVGVGFRFDRNPFKKADPPTPQGGGGEDGRDKTDKPTGEEGSPGTNPSGDDDRR